MLYLRSSSSALGVIALAWGCRPCVIYIWLEIGLKVYDEYQRRVEETREEDRQESGGKRQPGSGSGWVHQNDVKDEMWLREMKQTNGKSISIKAEDWEKLRGQRPDIRTAPDDAPADRQASAGRPRREQLLL